MLTITNLAEYRARVQHKEEIREAVIGNDSVSFCYMISAEGTFDDAWAREARGIVFSQSGGFVSGRPLHKFFNVNEREETRVENLDWTNVVRVMDKRDGSMIHSVWTMDGLRLKSKKSFDSDVAKAAEVWMHNEPGLNVWRFITRMAAIDHTAIFEWTAPDARIVLAYNKPELRLLHVRHNTTGVYMHSEDLREWAAQFGVNLVDEVDEFWLRSADGASKTLDVEAMLEAAKTREGVEGWVVQFSDGNMVKLKTEWCLKRHRAMTFLRERDIAEAVLDESLDDLKALMVGEGVDISELLKIEAEVVRQLNEVKHWVEEIVAKDGQLPRKDFAIKYQREHAEYGWFGLLMVRYLGKEPNYKEWYTKHALKEKWSLRQLVLVQTIAEQEG